MHLSLMSVEFFTLSVAAAVLSAVFSGMLRQIAFLSVNLFFLWGMLLGPSGTLSTIIFCLLGYALIQLILWRPHSGFWGAIVLYVSLFLYMRRYDFLMWVMPESMLIQALNTVGLSFLFFKVVHVMIEAHSGTIGTLRFATYLNYCLNFTTFMMGPIQRYQDFYAQFHGTKEAIPPQFEAHLDAVLRILVGLVKAYVLALWFADRALQPNTDVFELSFVQSVSESLCFLLFSLSQFFRLL